MAGLYIHIPFCKSKCPYCDFYSLTDISLAREYTKRVVEEIEKADTVFDTLYIGGGTPSVIGGEALGKIVSAARVKPDGEITVECNPSSTDEALIKHLAAVGVNRISMGLQSAVDGERKKLGRLSSGDKASRAVEYCRLNGIENVSLDLMLGIIDQNMHTLDESLDFCISLGVPHLSVYMLKIEEGTFFYKNREKLSLPDEDEVCDMYLHTVEVLEKNGLHQYEISNFAAQGRQGKHNLNYWDCGEYLGIGAAAHSFIDGKRFYYERSIDAFLDNSPPVEDGTGGDFEEYVMLRLRLREGLREYGVKSRFTHGIPQQYYEKASFFEKKGLAEVFDDGFALTKEGFLLSNTVIAEFLI